MISTGPGNAVSLNIDVAHRRTAWRDHTAAARRSPAPPKAWLSTPNRAITMPRHAEARIFASRPCCVHPGHFLQGCKGSSGSISTCPSRRQESYGRARVCGRVTHDASTKRRGRAEIPTGNPDRQRRAATARRCRCAPRRTRIGPGHAEHSRPHWATGGGRNTGDRPKDRRFWMR